LGTGRLLAPPCGGVLQWLNASAAELWDRFAAQPPDTTQAAAVRWLSAQYGLAPDHAAQEIAALLAAWEQAGLLISNLDGEVAAPWQNDWVIPAPPATAADAATQCVELAQLPMGLLIDDAELGVALKPVLQCLCRPASQRQTHVWRLTGPARGWRLTRNAQPFASGQTADSALTTLLSALVNHACKAEDRLLVVHVAGLVGPDGRALLLIGPGGSGKTTLAAALNAEGMALLSDDVAPVRRDGRLLALNTPLCLKPGSWPVLAARRPDLAAAPTFERLGQTVRYLPPQGPALREPLGLALLLFPRYQPHQPARREPLSPEAALQGLVAAEAVIRGLDQAKLDDLARWVAAVPAYALTYPDLATGVAQTLTLLDTVTP